MSEYFTVEFEGEEIHFDIRSAMACDYFNETWPGSAGNATEMINDILEDLDKHPSKYFCDVGCFLGFYSVLIAKLRPKVFVHAIDMNPQAVLECHINMRINKCDNYQVLCAAAYNKRAFAAFHQANPNNPQSNHLSDAGHQVVPCITLDEYFMLSNQFPAVYKIDVEGSELFTLSGMQSLMHKGHVRSIYLEYHKAVLEKQGFNEGHLTMPLVEQSFKHTTYWKTPRHEMWRIYR